MSFAVISSKEGEQPVIIGNLQRKDVAETLCDIMNHLSDMLKAGYVYSVCPLPRLVKRDGVQVLEQYFEEDKEMIPIIALSTELRKNKIVKQFLEAHNETAL
ncbi:MAG: hypothetical protein IKA01_10105 [Alistipes sp.]|nr:hypothetical protein [Alistipes sp.]